MEVSNSKDESKFMFSVQKAHERYVKSKLDGHNMDIDSFIPVYFSVLLSYLTCSVMHIYGIVEEQADSAYAAYVANSVVDDFCINLKNHCEKMINVKKH